MRVTNRLTAIGWGVGGDEKGEEITKVNPDVKCMRDSLRDGTIIDNL